jgi:hypothetical protein
MNAMSSDMRAQRANNSCSLTDSTLITVLRKPLSKNLRDQVDTFLGVRLWLIAQERQVEQQVEAVILRTGHGRKSARRCPVPDSLVDRWMEIQARKQQLAREQRRFLRRNRINQ